MKNLKSILMLVFLSAGMLLQAYANPAEREGGMKLKNKVALVTGAASGNGRAIASLLRQNSSRKRGAASGNGRAIASLFAKEGAKIVIADINADGANAFARELSERGFDAIAVHADECLKRHRQSY